MVLPKADNAATATHTEKCLIPPQRKYVVGRTRLSNSCPIISAVFLIVGCIVTWFHAEFATDSTPHCRGREPISTPSCKFFARTLFRSAPAPVELERLTIDWIRQILGFDASAGGLFVSGGSMANLVALAAARQAVRSTSKSISKNESALRMYASSETHFSIAKAAALLGIGRDHVQHVAVDEHFKIRTDDLVTKITADLEAGYVPFCVVANAGTVNTGAVDPLTEVREIADRFQLWMHVDGSYGAFAVLAESAKKLFAGMERADSIALDPHKW